MSDRFDEMVQELEDKSRRLTQAVRRAWAAGNDNQARNLQQLQENLLAAVDRYRAGVGTVILEKSEEE